MEAQEIQTLKPTYSRLSTNGEKWMPIPLPTYPNWLKRPRPVKKFRLDVGDGYLWIEIFRSRIQDISFCILLVESFC